MTTATPRYSRLHVVLHGYGAEPGDIAAIAPVVDPDDRFVTIAPRGPIAAGAGASWYDFDNAWLAHPASFSEGLSYLDATVDQACTAAGVARADIVVGGFSQGAGMAAWLAFGTASPPPAGFWCCGTIVDVDGEALDLAPAAHARALVLAGRSDRNVPLTRSRDQAQRLRAAGADVTYSEHDGGHALSVSMLDDMRTWLATFP